MSYFNRNSNIFDRRFADIIAAPDEESMARAQNSFLMNPSATMPQADDIAFARQAGMGYGSGQENYLAGNQAQFLKQSVVGKYPSQIDTSQIRPEAAKPGDASDEYMRTYVLANQLPLAALGFDARKIAIDIASPKTGLGGQYVPKTDSIYTSAQYTGAALHESIHRGLQIMKKIGVPEAATLDDRDEEMLTRFLVMKFGANADSSLLTNESLKKAEDYVMNRPDLQQAAISLQYHAVDMIKKNRMFGPR
mgnify:CR=1 FL=1